MFFTFLADIGPTPAALLLSGDSLALRLPRASGSTGGPLSLALSPQPDELVRSRVPQLQSANFLQVSDHLLDWYYDSLTLSGSSSMRTLEFPGTPGPRFFSVRCPASMWVTILIRGLDGDWLGDAWESLHGAPLVFSNSAAHPGFLYVQGLNSAGKLVGELQRVASAGQSLRRTTWALHADIDTASISPWNRKYVAEKLTAFPAAYETSSGRGAGFPVAAWLSAKSRTAP